MSTADWARFEHWLDQTTAETQARAHGVVLAQLMDAAERVSSPARPLHWMDWERQKTLRLLRCAV